VYFSRVGEGGDNRTMAGLPDVTPARDPGYKLRMRSARWES